MKLVNNDIKNSVGSSIGASVWDLIVDSVWNLNVDSILDSIGPLVRSSVIGDLAIKAMKDEASK